MLGLENVLLRDLNPSAGFDEIHQGQEVFHLVCRRRFLENGYSSSGELSYENGVAVPREGGDHEVRLVGQKGVERGMRRYSPSLLKLVRSLGPPDEHAWNFEEIG